MKKTLSVLMTGAVCLTAIGGFATTAMADEENVTIKFMYYADDTQKAILEEACADYEASHPGITIEQTVVPSDGSITTTIATLASSGDLPDVSYMAEADVIKYADAGLLYSLDDAIADGIVGEKLDAVTIRGKDGKIYGLGLSNQLEIMYYNKDLFDQYEVEYPGTTVEDAWDWDTFLENAQKLTIDSNGNNALSEEFDANSIEQYGVAFSNFYQFSYMWSAYANGGGIVSADGTQLLWGEEASLEGIQKIADLINVYHVCPSTTSSMVSNIGSADQALISGDVAMYINGSWDLSNAIKAKTEAGVNYGIGVLPKMEKAITMNAGGPAVLFSTTQHPQEALEFYAYMMDPSLVVSILETGAWLPNEVSWYTDEAKIEQWTSGENVTDEAKSVILSYSTTEGTIAQWPVYYVNNWAEMMSVSDSVMDSIWNGDGTAADILGSVMGEIQAAFEAE